MGYLDAVTVLLWDCSCNYGYGLKAVSTAGKYLVARAAACTALPSPCTRFAAGGHDFHHLGAAPNQRVLDVDDKRAHHSPTKPLVLCPL